MKKKYFFLLFILFFPLVAQAQEVILDVPFSPQAPDAKWVEPWENACEETSLVMVNAYYTQENLSPKKAKSEILSVIKTKNKNEGESKDESPTKIVRMIQKLGKWDAKVEESIDLEKIKSEIDQKHPVIFPFDAKKVKNPIFDGQVDYHVAVIIGYDDATKEFIVNDPGMSKGASTRYSYEEFLEANKSFMVRDTSEMLGNVAVFTYPSNQQSDIFHRLWSLLTNLFA